MSVGGILGVMSTRLTASEAPWQIEIDWGAGKPAKYISAKAIKLTPKQMTIVTPDGEHLVLKSGDMRKLLIMATKDES